MKVLFISFCLVTLLPFRGGNCSFEFIKKNCLLGIYPDSVSNRQTDSLILAWAREIKMIERGQSFNCPPTLSQRFRFTEMPGVFLYSLDACSYISAGTIRDPFELVLFDSVTSEKYHFMGDIESFNKVIRRALSSNMNEHYIYDIIRLYLNSLGPTSIYYILNSYSDFENFYNRELHISNSPLKEYPFFHDKINADFAKAHQNIPNSSWFLKGKNYLYSLNWGQKRLEFWQLKITPYGLNIVKREIIMENLGTTP